MERFAAEFKEFKDHVLTDLKEIKSDLRNLNAWKMKVMGASALFAFLATLAVELFR